MNSGRGGFRVSKVGVVMSLGVVEVFRVVAGCCELD